MNISRFELILDFAEETRLHTHSHIVSKALGEELLDEEYQPVIVRDEKDKFGVRWDYEECGIIKEDIGDEKECINTFVATLESINNVAPLGKLSMRYLRVDWIFPVSDKYDFKTLEVKYRQAFIKENELFRECYDSSVVIDMKYDQLTLHHQSGAMDLAQLQDMFKVFTIKEGHPSLFLFLNTQVTDKQLTTYSRDDMENFIQHSFQLCKTHAEVFGKTVEGIL